MKLARSIVLRLTMSPSVYRTFVRLDTCAQTGDFDLPLLQALQATAGVTQHKSTVYYLASLYLQLGEDTSAFGLLSSFGSASSEMKNYCAVLQFSRLNQLPMPKLSARELNCLDYLERVVNPNDVGMDTLIRQHGGYSIVGNAPSAGVVQNQSTACKFYFNSYQKNQRITGSATVHVVTPSWNMDESSDYLCITGNSIFHRRSRVWLKFINKQQYKAVFTFPRQLWMSLYKEFATSPSAGLLTLSYIANVVDNMSVSGHVAGFSTQPTDVNHSYDSEPASVRHNWAAEQIRYQALIDSLRDNCSECSVEA